MSTAAATRERIRTAGTTFAARASPSRSSGARARHFRPRRRQTTTTTLVRTCSSRPSGLQTVTSVSYWLRNIAFEELVRERARKRGDA
jgi:hypothetical protein